MLSYKSCCHDIMEIVARVAVAEASTWAFSIYNQFMHLSKFDPNNIKILSFPTYMAVELLTAWYP